MRAWPCVLLAAAMLSSGCGYVGDPQPPALLIPGRVADLSAVQIGDRVVIRFTIPERTTDGFPLRLGKVDLRAGPYATSPFDAEAWAAQAAVLDTSGLGTGPAKLEIPIQRWMGQVVLFRVRLVNHRGRAGEWSDFVTLRIVPALGRPSGLKAEASPEGVRLSWTGPSEPEGLEYRILRSTNPGKPGAEVGRVKSKEWMDPDTRYGETYYYTVVTLLRTDDAHAESLPSETAAIRPEDRFPPAVPSGLTALAGPASVELSWDPNTEPDLAGYLVYRAANGREFERVGGLLTTPSFSDKDVRAGVRYRYAVSSVDQSGNESSPSAAVEITVP